MKNVISIALAALVVLSTGCTSTPQGKAIDRANIADVASTGVALAAGASEGNPVGLALAPIKGFMGYAAEKMYPKNCIARAHLAGVAGTVYYGATVNNLVVAAGASAGPVAGLGAAIVYYFFKEKIEPGVYSCIPEEKALEQFAEMYSKGDAQALSEAFTQDAVTTDATGRDAIRKDYESFFSGNSERWVKWRWYDPKTGQGEMWAYVDGRGGPYQVTITLKDGLISRMVW